MKKRIFAALLVLLLLLCACGAEEPWQAAYRRTGQALAAQEDYGVGSIGGEWAVIGLSRSELLKQETAQAYLQTVEDYVRSIGTVRLDHAKSTENSRIILGVTAAGGDVTDIGGVNLLEGLTDMTFVSYQGLNGPIWALIALDCGGYEIPDAQPGEAQTTREALGIDPQKDARFLKNGRSVLDALCDFVLDDGFYHSAELVEVNGMATEQAYYALTAYARFRDGKSRLFDMTELTAA